MIDIQVGYVKVSAKIGNPERDEIVQLEFLVDTGAFFTAVPFSLAQRIGVKPMSKTKATLADNREVNVSLSYAYIEIQDRSAVLPVAIMDVPEPLLGVTTLEALGLKVNPLSGELEKTRSFAIGQLLEGPVDVRPHLRNVRSFQSVSLPKIPGVANSHHQFPLNLL
ncbi:MAG: clan AA aspartic protease [Nitrososphaerales archaeon]|nr:clan AA aspartic protease [Nitrososphaerales archaeon]